MASLLRQPAHLARFTRQTLYTTSRSSRPLSLRPASIPRPLFAYQRIRQYATQPEEPNDKKVDKTPGKPPAGFEGFYDNGSPMSPGPGGPKKDGENGTKPGYTPLTKEEEKQLTELFTHVKKGMPASLGEDIDKTLAQIRKDGIPNELRDTMNEMSKNGMTPASAAKLWRLTSQMARKSVESERAEAKKAAEAEGAQKGGAHDPGPGKSKAKGKQEGFQPGEIRLDLNNILISAFVSYILYRVFVPSENSKEITWEEFRSHFMDKGLVEKLVVVNNNRVRVSLHRDQVGAMYPDSPAASGNFHYYFTIGSVESFERRVDEAQKDLDIPTSERIPVAYESEGTWLNIFLTFAPTLLFIAGLTWMSRRGMSGGGQSGIFGMGRSRARKFNHETDVKVKFSDVAGMDEAKTEIMEFVSFLKEPGMYQKLGAKIPRGAILSGPPGTGKTLLAKATAGESGVPFFSVSGSEFVEMFVGVGASRVRDLFANARKNTPCIIFIDEIDAIGKARGNGKFGGGNEERETTLNQILTEMDGFNTSEQVVVLAGTNRADVLDKALMRPGRFDRHISVDPPTMDGRKQIFGVHLKKIVTKEDLEYLKGRLAALTPGFAGADIANCVNEAALIGKSIFAL